MLIAGVGTAAQLAAAAVGMGTVAVVGMAAAGLGPAAEHQMG